MMNSTSNNQRNTGQKASKKLPLVGQSAVIGRKCKQFSAVNLSNTQWFLVLYVAGFGSLLLLVTLLKAAMKLM